MTRRQMKPITTGCVVVTFRCNVCYKEIQRWGMVVGAQLKNYLPRGWVFTRKYELRCASCNKENLDPWTGEKVQMGKKR